MRGRERDGETRPLLHFEFHVTMFIAGIANKMDKLFYAFDIMMKKFLCFRKFMADRVLYTYTEITIFLKNLKI